MVSELAESGNATGSRPLERYVRTKAEDAFASVLHEHLDLVYSAALRQCHGNTSAAEDVTQGVFIELAKNADRLVKHPTLVGWLYTTTRCIASNHARSESRRFRREKELALLSDPAQGPEMDLLDWDRIAIVLDLAMADLEEKDRLAILLRFFEGKDHRSVGVSLGLGENAARMRVERALEKLRKILLRHGIQSSAPALGAIIAANAVVSSPAAIVTPIMAASLMVITSASKASTIGFLGIMSSANIKTIVTSGLLIALSIPLVVQRNQLRTLQEENLRLKQWADRTPAEPAPVPIRPDAPGGDALTSEERSELLRLRGDVGVLRRQLAEASTRLSSQKTTAKLGAADANIQPSEEEKEAYKADGIVRLNVARQWLLGFLLYSGDHGDKFPEQFDQALSYLGNKDPGLDSGMGADLFEIVFKGSQKSVTDPARTIVIREIKPRRNLGNDGWVRTYGFLDGHSEIHKSPTEDFSKWESERLYLKTE